MRFYDKRYYAGDGERPEREKPTKEELERFARIRKAKETMRKRWYNPFYETGAEALVYNAIMSEISKALHVIFKKYRDKVKTISEIKKRGLTGFELFKIEYMIRDFVEQDEELKNTLVLGKQTKSKIKKQMVRAFKDLFTEVLEQTSVDPQTGEVKNKKLLLVEKIVSDTINGSISNETINAVKFIRDSVGEKPVEEILTRGLEAKVIDINITEDKVARIKRLLDGIKKGGVLSGFKQNISTGTSDGGSGNERVVEVNVSGQSEGVYLPDVVSDKQS